ncbi:MAG TPA: 30S ribosomal protein S12 methylthiotransferase RimO [Acidimicrobiia bacterium]|nr:30S ribosomal protein S12 methylthiotransferase RimO [Acidimicrobiia bacterium]
MSAPTIWLTTLGCAKNQVDSEKLVALLAEAGYAAASAPEQADVVMVNTCAFIEEARRESVDAICELEQVKRPGARTVVLGCMAQRFGVEVGEALPEVDLVLGLDRYGELIPSLDRLTGWRPVTWRRPVMDILYTVRRARPSLPYAYVKVAEGCDKPCTFCAIPLIRGKQRSRPAGNIAGEIAELTASGVSEVVLVAQDLAAYGRDLSEEGGLVELIHRVGATPGLRRLRLLYLYPREIRPELIAEMTSNPVVAPYFDLSLQHSSPRLLRAMKRAGGGEAYLALIASIREANPEAALRSSFIVGFPGETEDEVEELAEFLAEVRLDWAGFFPYSAEEGTPAALLPGRSAPQEVSERVRYLQATQEELTTQAALAQVGRQLTVVVDQVEEGVAVARSYREAPEIDGVINLDRGRSGEWLEVEVTGAYGAELAARVVGTAP